MTDINKQLLKNQVEIANLIIICALAIFVGIVLIGLMLLIDDYMRRVIWFVLIGLLVVAIISATIFLTRSRKYKLEI